MDQAVGGELESGRMICIDDVKHMQYVIYLIIWQHICHIFLGHTPEPLWSMGEQSTSLHRAGGIKKGVPT